MKKPGRESAKFEVSFGPWNGFEIPDNGEVCVMGESIADAVGLEPDRTILVRG